MKNPLKVSQVEIIPFRPRNGHLGFASCVINDQIYLSDVAIFSRPAGGVRLGFPVKRLANGSAIDIFKPLNETVEKVFEAAVLEKFESLHECNGIAKESTNEKHNT